MSTRQKRTRISLFGIAIFALLQFSWALDVDVAVGESIQDAVDKVSAAGGGLVNLASGIHQINTSIKMESNVTLNGEGPDLTTINTDKVITSIEQASEGLENVTIQNLNVTGVAVDGSQAICIISLGTDHNNIKLLNVHASITGWGVHIKGAKDVTITNCEFTENGAPGKEGYAHNLYLRRCYNATVTKCKLNRSTTGNGCNISYSENITVDSCEMLDNYFRGVRAANTDGYTVTNCIAGGNGKVGILANSEGVPTTNINIDNNIVFDNDEGGIQAVNGVTGSVTNNISFDNGKFNFSLPSGVVSSGNSENPVMVINDYGNRPATRQKSVVKPSVSIRLGFKTPGCSAGPLIYQKGAHGVQIFDLRGRIIDKSKILSDVLK